MGAFGYGVAGTDEALDAVDMYRKDIARVVARPKTVKALLTKVARSESAESVLAVANELWLRGVDLRHEQQLLKAHVAAELAPGELRRWRQRKRRRAALLAFMERVAKQPPSRRAPPLQLPEPATGPIHTVREARDGLRAFCAGGGIRPQWGYLDAKRRPVIPAQFHRAWDFHDGHAVVSIDADEDATRQRYMRIDRSARVVAALDFDDVWLNSFPRLASRDGVYGYVDEIGAWTIAPQFDKAEPFVNGRALVYDKDKRSYWLIDPRGKRLTDRFERIVEHDGCWHVVKRGKHGVLDAKFRPLIPCRYDYLDYFFEGVARVAKGNGRARRYGLIDIRGRTLAPLTWNELLGFSGGLAVVKKGRRAGFIRRDGTLAIPLVFDDATTFSKEGLAAASRGGKWGIIDREGATVVPFSYGALRTFSEGLAAAQFESGRWGYIDLENRTVIAPKFTRAEDFVDGIAKVWLSGPMKRIDRSGHTVR
jgi:hypothetical protein